MATYPRECSLCTWMCMLLLFAYVLIEPRSPVLQADSSPSELPGKPIFYIYIENLSSQVCYLRLVFPYWYFFLGDLSIDVNGVLTVPYHYCNPVGLIYSGALVLGFPGGTSGKEASCQCSRHWRRMFTPWVGKIPWRRAWQPTPVFLPGESHEQRRLVGYSA